MQYLENLKQAHSEPTSPAWPPGAEGLAEAESDGQDALFHKLEDKLLSKLLACDQYSPQAERFLAWRAERRGSPWSHDALITYLANTGRVEEAVQLAWSHPGNDRARPEPIVESRRAAECYEALKELADERLQQAEMDQRTYDRVAATINVFAGAREAPPKEAEDLKKMLAEAKEDVNVGKREAAAQQRALQKSAREFLTEVVGADEHGAYRFNPLDRRDRRMVQQCLNHNNPYVRSWVLVCYDFSTRQDFDDPLRLGLEDDSVVVRRAAVEATKRTVSRIASHGRTADNDRAASLVPQLIALLEDEACHKEALECLQKLEVDDRFAPDLVAAFKRWYHFDPADSAHVQQLRTNMGVVRTLFSIMSELEQPGDECLQCCRQYLADCSEHVDVAAATNAIKTIAKCSHAEIADVRLYLASGAPTAYVAPALCKIAGGDIVPMLLDDVERYSSSQDSRGRTRLKWTLDLLGGTYFLHPEWFRRHRARIQELLAEGGPAANQLRLLITR